MSRSGSRSKLGASASKGQKKGKTGKNNEPEEDEGPPEIEVPQLEWKVLSEEMTKELAGLEVEHVATKLAGVLSLSHHEDDLREAAILDYYVSGYWYATREEGFTDSQVSAFITILHTLLNNIKNNQMSLVDNIQAFKSLVAAVGLPPSPDLPNPLKCFTKEKGLATLHYLQSSLFQHYSLFQYLFSEEQEKEIITHKALVDVPPDPTTLCPPPLEEAVTVDLYQRCISPPPPPTERQDDNEGSIDKHGHDETTEGEDVVRMMKVTPDELKDIMDSVAKSTLTNYKDEVSQKLKKKEETMLNRLSKLEKSLT